MTQIPLQCCHVSEELCISLNAPIDNAHLLIYSNFSSILQNSGTCTAQKVRIFKFQFLFYHALVAQVTPNFQKFTLRHFAFTKDLHQHLFLLRERNPKSIFAFRKTSEKQKQFQHWFCSSRYRGSAHRPPPHPCRLPSRNSTTKPLPHAQHLSIKPRQL